jgi:hypothetical protein
MINADHLTGHIHFFILFIAYIAFRQRPQCNSIDIISNDSIAYSIVGTTRLGIRRASTVNQIHIHTHAHISKNPLKPDLIASASGITTHRSSQGSSQSSRPRIRLLCSLHQSLTICSTSSTTLARPSLSDDGRSSRARAQAARRGQT